MAEEERMEEEEEVDHEVPERRGELEGGLRQASNK